MKEGKGQGREGGGKGGKKEAGIGREEAGSVGSMRESGVGKYNTFLLGYGRSSWQASFAQGGG